MDPNVTASYEVLCPNCGESINVEQLMRDKIKAEFTAQHAELLEKTQAFEERRKKANEEYIHAREKDREKIRQEIARKIAQDHADTLAKKDQVIRGLMAEKMKAQSLQEQLKQKEIEAEYTNKLAIEKARTEIMKSERAKAMQKLEALRQEDATRRQEDATRSELKTREQAEMIETLKKINEEMRRKIEQGSMQSQGEVQELIIEEWLKAQFPQDAIEEVKKGERGADVIHRVIHKMGWECGTIYYESKRTKGYSKEWISKLRENMQRIQATLGVLVLTFLPKEFPQATEKDGIWICSLAEFKILCAVFRSSLMEQAEQRKVQENREEKMDTLYHFLIGPYFKRYVQNVIHAFTQLETELRKEKNYMQGVWKKREYFIKQSQTNMIEMYAEVQAISGGKVEDIPELDYYEDLKKKELAPGELPIPNAYFKEEE